MNPSFVRSRLAVVATGLLLVSGAATTEAQQSGAAPQVSAQVSGSLIGNVRQLTFEGLRAGEGYYSADGSQMIFQSERDPSNPFYQMYLMDLATGDVRRLSPGYGKTTCGWISPDKKRVIFASTQDDP